MYYIAEFFTKPFDSEYKENKKFAAQALRNTGFGTPKSEEKITNEISVMIKYLEDKKGTPFKPRIPLESTTANCLLSILLNLRYPWGSDELKRVLQITEDFMNSGIEAFTLTFINQYLPLFLIKLLFRSKMESCRAKVAHLKDFIKEYIQSHKATLNPNESRDLIDTFLIAGKDASGINKFATTISAFFPDGIESVADAVNWIIIYLAYNMEDQKRGQKEIDEV